MSKELHAKLDAAVEEIGGQILGRKGKRHAQHVTENVLDMLELTYSKAQRPTFTMYDIVVNEENGACKSLFISYTSDGTVKEISTH